MLLAFLVATPLAALGAETLSSLIVSKRYSEATNFAKQQKPEQVISQVKPLAMKNDAPAQWILADAYWRGNKRQEAIQWGYTALVSTQLDVSSCRLKENVVPWMMQTYQVIFREARRHPDIQSKALRFAMNHHAEQTTLPTDQAWACRLGAYLNGRKQETGTIGSSGELVWRRRDSALKSLAKTAGIKVDISSRPVATP